MILLIIMALMNPVKAAEPDFELLTPAAYARLDSKSQSTYINNIRKSWVAFEKKYPLPKDKNTFLKNIFIDQAFAEGKPCIIGGSVLTAVRANSGRYVCPTTGKGCEGQSDGFRCGAVFGEACISRLPISNISERCYESRASIVDKNNYEYVLNTMAKDLEIICSQRSNSPDGCRFLAKKMTEATNEMKIKIAALDRYNQANPAVTPAANVAAGTDESPDFVNVETPAPSAVARDRREVAAVSASACSSGSRRQGKAIAPPFDLISGNTCVFQDNKRIVDALTSKGCSGRKITGNLISTEISSTDGSRLYGQANRFPTIITNAEVVERKSATEAIFSVRMFKYDISVDPPKLQQISAKIQQKDGQFTFFNAYGIPQKIKIQNNTRDSITLSNISGYKSLMTSMFRMADDCLLTEDLVALQPSSGSSSGVGSAGSR